MKEIKFLIFEGGDVCGKTTQCKQMMKKLDHCLYFKFPLLTGKYSTSIQKLNKNLFEGIYDVDKTDGLFSTDENIIGGKKTPSAIKELIKYNILINYYEKRDFLDMLDLLLKGCLSGQIYNIIDTETDLLNNLIISDGTDTIGPKYNLCNDPVDRLIKISLLHHILTDESKPLYIILDRFVLTGIVYNTKLPLEYIRKYDISEYCEELYSEINDITRTSVIDLFTKLNEIVSPGWPTKNVLVTSPNIINIVFKKSNILRKMFYEDKTRKHDKFDINNDITEIVSNSFKNLETENDIGFITDFNILEVDTDLIYNNTSGYDCNLKDYITRVIFTSVQSKFNYDDTVSKQDTESKIIEEACTRR